MANNVISYPEMGSEKFTGIDPAEDARAFFSLVAKKATFSLGNRPANNNNNAQDIYDARQRAFFGSLMRGPAAEWFDGQDAAQTWAELEAAFVDRFTNGIDKYKFQIEAENITRQPDEFIKTYIHRIRTTVDKGWPIPAAGQPGHNNGVARRQAKYIDNFLRGLTPPSLKQAAYKHMIEHPDTTWDELQTHVINKDISFTVSANRTGQKSGDSSSRLADLENQIKELTSLLKDNKINAITNSAAVHAAYDPNSPRDRQNHTRFCKYCKESGHTVQYCERLKAMKAAQQRPPPARPETYNDHYRSRPKSRDISRNHQGSVRTASRDNPYRYSDTAFPQRPRDYSRENRYRDYSRENRNHFRDYRDFSRDRRDFSRDRRDYNSNRSDYSRHRPNYSADRNNRDYSRDRREYSGNYNDSRRQGSDRYRDPTPYRRPNSYDRSRSREHRDHPRDENFQTASRQYREQSSERNSTVKIDNPRGNVNGVFDCVRPQAPLN